MVRRPVRMTLDELRFAVVAPAVAGVLLVAIGQFGPRSFPRMDGSRPSRVTLIGAGFLVSGARSTCSRGCAAGSCAAARWPRRAPYADDEPVPSPAPQGWLRAGHAAGIPWLYRPGLPDHRAAGGLRRQLHPLVQPGQPADRRDPGGPHRRQHAVEPDHRDVQLPQQPARRPRRLVAVVGVAAGPEAGLVLPARLRRQHHGRHLRRREPGAHLAGHPGHGLHGLGGLAPPQPRADRHRGDVPGHVAALDAHRPGDLPVPRLHAACRSPPWRWPTSSRSCGTVRRPAHGCWPALRPRSRSSARRSSGWCASRSAWSAGSAAAHAAEGSLGRDRLRRDHALHGRQSGRRRIGGGADRRHGGARLAALAALSRGRRGRRSDPPRPRQAAGRGCALRDAAGDPGRGRAGRSDLQPGTRLHAVDRRRRDRPHRAGRARPCRPGWFCTPATPAASWSVC